MLPVCVLASQHTQPLVAHAHTYPTWLSRLQLAVGAGRDMMVLAWCMCCHLMHDSLANLLLLSLLPAFRAAASAVGAATRRPPSPVWR